MKFGNIIGKSPEIRQYSPGALLRSTDLLGLEFEYEGVRNAVLPPEYPYNLFTTHEDDSLKDRGREFVYSEPLFGMDVEQSITALCALAKDRQWISSKRAGIHVHMDVRDLTSEQVIGFILLYSLVEPALYNWVGDRRDKSIYCTPLYEVDATTASIANLLFHCRAGVGSEILSQANSIPRYCGINLNALSKFGSMEFRHLKSTHDSARVLMWVQLILKLKDAVRTKFPVSHHDMIDFAERLGAESFLQFVFDDLYTQLSYPKWQYEYKTLALPVAENLVAEGLKELTWDNLVLPKGTHSGLALFDARHSRTKGATPKLRINDLVAGQRGRLGAFDFNLRELEQDDIDRPE